jgi:hypothetical protein
MLHGTGIVQPTNPQSGLWVLQSASLITVEKAFKEIGLSTGQRADTGIPENMIAIYFGYRAIKP